MFDTIVENIEPNRVTRYFVTRNGESVTFRHVLDLWQNDADFRKYYTQLLADSPFPAYRWETPSLSESTVNQPFQFVLLNCPIFCSRRSDPKTYDLYFTDDDSNCGLVSFANLRGDATLIVPSPRTDVDVYGHLADFIRLAPELQVDAFWRAVSTSVMSQISDSPLWLSTAGGGVAWLHVRLDSRPKYYSFSPYKKCDGIGNMGS